MTKPKPPRPVKPLVGRQKPAKRQRQKGKAPTKAAEPEPKPAKEPPNRSDSGLLDAALKGDERGILEATLKMLAKEAETAEVSRLPAIVREIRSVSRDLQKLPKGGKSRVDEIKAKRERRRSGRTASTRR